MNDILSIVVASIFSCIILDILDIIEIDWNSESWLQILKTLKKSFVFLIRHSLYGIVMFEGFRWFT